MVFLNTLTVFISFLSYNLVAVDSKSVKKGGVMLLYQPKDITLDCASSLYLRYDLTFGMGMSDTITLTLRTMQDKDYECEVDITSDRVNYLIVAIKFPTTIGYNCAHNPEAFHVMKYDYCYPICNQESLDRQDLLSRHWVLYTKGRFRFQFRSNSSINADIGAYMYEVTLTTARLLTPNDTGCYGLNETECFAPLHDEHYCITSGVMCDGINNCGVDHWYDERKSDCNMPLEKLGYAPILALIGLFIYIILTFVHILRRCLPKGTSYFIYNINEDNRLRTDPILVPGRTSESESAKRMSVIRIQQDSSDGEDEEEKVPEWISVSSQEEKNEEVVWMPPLRRMRLTVPQRLSRVSRHFKSVIGLNPRDLRAQLGATVKTGGLDWKLKEWHDRN